MYYFFYRMVCLLQIFLLQIHIINYLLLPKLNNT